jgi:hypothetical protein
MQRMTNAQSTKKLPPREDDHKEHMPSAYNLFISATAVVAVGVLVWQWTLKSDSEVKALLVIFDWGFCALFFIDFLHNISTAKHKIRYLYTWGPFDLLSSIPIIAHLRFARFASVFRIIRVLRSFRILAQVWERDKAASVVALMMMAGIATVIGVRQVQKSTNTDSLEDRLIRMEHRQRDFQIVIQAHIAKQESDG